MLLAFFLLLHGYKHCKQKIYLYHSDTIACVSFAELKYLFHQPYEYYAVGSKSSCKIPEKMIMKYFGEEVTRKKIQNTNYYDNWNVLLYYSGGREYDFQEVNTLETSYGNQYKIVCEYYGAKKNHQITFGEQQKMLEITETLYKGKRTEEFPGEEREIMRYELIHEDDIWYIITGSTPAGKTLMRVTNEGKLVKVLEISEGFIDAWSLYFYEH